MVTMPVPPLLSAREYDVLFALGEPVVKLTVRSLDKLPVIFRYKQSSDRDRLFELSIQQHILNKG